MGGKEEGKRILYLDIAKTLLIFSFVYSHIYLPPVIGHYLIYWNTGCFIIFSGYLTGFLLQDKALHFSYGIQKFIKFNFWVAMYLASMILLSSIPSQSLHIRAGFHWSANYISIIEYIGLFYMTVPILKYFKNRGMASFFCFLFIIFTTYYFTAFHNLSDNSAVSNLLLMLFKGNSFSLSHYPLASFMSLGFLGYSLRKLEEKRESLGIFFLIVLVLCYGLLYMKSLGIIDLSIKRKPMLMFYAVYSLTVFVLLIKVSMFLQERLKESRLTGFITKSSQYSILFFFFHMPLLIILEKLQGGFILGHGILINIMIALFESIFVYMLLYFLFMNTIERLPAGIRKKLF